MTIYQQLVLMLLTRLVANTGARLMNKQEKKAEKLFEQHWATIIKGLLVEEGVEVAAKAEANKSVVIHP